VKSLGRKLALTWIGVACYHTSLANHDLAQICEIWDGVWPFDVRSGKLWLAALRLAELSLANVIRLDCARLASGRSRQVRLRWANMCVVRVVRWAVGGYLGW